MRLVGEFSAPNAGPLQRGCARGVAGAGRRHSGLGLSLCVNFMTLFGGALEMESAPGVETMVTLRFPADRVFDGA